MPSVWGLNERLHNRGLLSSHRPARTTIVEVKRDGWYHETAPGHQKVKKDVFVPGEDDGSHQKRNTTTKKEGHVANCPQRASPLMGWGGGTGSHSEPLAKELPP